MIMSLNAGQIPYKLSHASAAQFSLNAGQIPYKLSHASAAQFLLKKKSLIF